MYCNLAKFLLVRVLAPLLVFVVLAPPARADFVWTAVESTTARAHANESAPSVFAVRKDQTYTVLGKTKNKWLKIKSQTGNTGFVPMSALQPSPAKTGAVAAPERTAVKASSLRAAAGVSATYSYITQAGRTFNDTSPAVEISQLTSSTVNFGVFYRYAFKDSFRVRGSVNMRKLDLNGTTKVLTGTVASSPGNLQVTQEFFGVGLAAEFMMGSSWWWGGGAEIAQATKSSVKTTNQSDQPEKPLYAVIQLLVGSEFSFGGVFVAPELRAQIIPNSTPMMMGAELATLIGVRF